MITEVEQAEKLQRQLYKVFAVNKTTRFAHLPYIGCCEEHEDELKWFRYHDWAELSDAITANKMSEVSFFMLCDEAYFTFVPGICLYALKLVSGWYERLDFSMCCIDYWVEETLILGRKDVSAVVKNYLSFEQYQCVNNILCFYNECLCEIEGYAVTIDAAGGRRTMLEQIERQWGNQNLFD